MAIYVSVIKKQLFLVGIISMITSFELLRCVATCIIQSARCDYINMSTCHNNLISHSMVCICLVLYCDYSVTISSINSIKFATAEQAQQVFQFRSAFGWFHVVIIVSQCTV